LCCFIPLHARELKIESVRAERRAQKKRLEQRQESEQEQKNH
jgi:hypothetical protein